MSYQEELIEHLIAYKNSHLGGPAAGIYKYRGADIPHHHILPTEDPWLNLMSTERRQIIGFLSSNSNFKRHKYFHHLNSSQAFALNLFIPYFEGGTDASAALLRALGQVEDLVTWEPEAAPDALEGTNLDAIWDTTDGRRTFCEVKLSERDFGRARADERHLNKLRDIYLRRLAPCLEPDLLRAPKFIASYQILRNVSHLIGTPNARLVFLIPRANTNLWKLLNDALVQLDPAVSTRIAPIAIEDVLSHLKSDTVCPPSFRRYAEELHLKYIPQRLVT